MSEAIARLVGVKSVVSLAPPLTETFELPLTSKDKSDGGKESFRPRETEVAVTFAFR